MNGKASSGSYSNISSFQELFYQSVKWFSDLVFLQLAAILRRGGRCRSTFSAISRHSLEDVLASTGSETSLGLPTIQKDQCLCEIFAMLQLFWSPWLSIYMECLDTAIRKWPLIVLRARPLMVKSVLLSPMVAIWCFGEENSSKCSVFISENGRESQNVQHVEKTIDMKSFSWFSKRLTRFWACWPLLLTWTEVDWALYVNK